MPFMDDTAYNMDVDVDDLFGDSEQVPLPAMPAAPVKGLARRLDELSASGCCQ
jgi:mediator of RNA polymerase II transcription subunit 16